LCGSTLSAPAKHRYAPPSIKIGVIAHGKKHSVAAPPAK
jgi:hypothetical protein